MPRRSNKDASQNFDDLLSRINVSADRLSTSKHFDNLEITLIQDLNDNGSKDLKGKKLKFIYSKFQDSQKS